MKAHTLLLGLSHKHTLYVFLIRMGGGFMFLTDADVMHLWTQITHLHLQQLRLELFPLGNVQLAASLTVLLSLP